jgi:hypothetical protein
VSSAPPFAFGSGAFGVNPFGQAQLITSNVAFLSPSIAEVLSECFERAGIAAASPGNDHIDSAIRSMKLMLNSEWLTLGMRTWQFQLLNLTTNVTVGATVVLPPGVLTVSDAVLRRDGRDTPINPMSRDEYLEIPDKTQTGRPDRYLIDKQYNQTVLTMWRSPENNTDQIFYWAMCNTAIPTEDLSQGLQMRPEILEAFHAGLAAKLALKFNAQRYETLQAYYRGADPNPRNIGGVLALALDANRDWGDVRFTFHRRRRSGRW